MLPLPFIRSNSVRNFSISLYWSPWDLLYSNVFLIALLKSLSVMDLISRAEAKEEASLKTIFLISAPTNNGRGGHSSSSNTFTFFLLPVCGSTSQPPISSFGSIEYSFFSVISLKMMSENSFTNLSLLLLPRRRGSSRRTWS